MGRTTSSVLLLALSWTAAAQYTSGIDGTVFDASGSPVPNAHVTVTNEATQLARSADTNGSGYFRVTDLGPADFRIEVRSAGFRDWVEANVQVDANQLRTVYPKLSIGEQKAQVEVSATVAGVETGQSSVASSIPQETIDLAPMEGRNIFAGVAFIAPGVTGSGFLFGGGGGERPTKTASKRSPVFRLTLAASGRNSTITASMGRPQTGIPGAALLT